MDMIERVARAIYKVDGEKGWRLHEKFYMDSARAAIDVMREPTPEMEKAGWLQAEQRDELAVWGAMIDAALNNEPPER